MVCYSCQTALWAGKVPDESLAALATGGVPAGPDGTSLPALSYIESALLAPYRTLQHVVLCRPHGLAARRPLQEQQQAARHAAPVSYL